MISGQKKKKISKEGERSKSTHADLLDRIKQASNTSNTDNLKAENIRLMQENSNLQSMIMKGIIFRMLFIRCIYILL